MFILVLAAESSIAAQSSIAAHRLSLAVESQASL